MNPLNKGPDGKFIGSEDALRVWLPTLLYHHCGNDPIEAVLMLCIDGLERDAATYLEWNVACISSKERNNLNPINMHGVRLCQRDLAKREVLVETIKKLRELK